MRVIEVSENLSAAFAGMLLAELGAEVIKVEPPAGDPWRTRPDFGGDDSTCVYANRRKTFFKVTLPLIAPGVAGGALLALTLSLDDVVVTQFVSGAGSTTLPVYVFGLVRRGVTPLINAVSVLMLVASMVLVGISLGFQRGAQARGQRLADPAALAQEITEG